MTVPLTGESLGESLADSLFEYAPDGILLVDAEGRILRANPQAEEIFGYTRKEVVGLSIARLLPHRYVEEQRQLPAGYTPAPRLRRMGVGLELHARRQSGDEFPVEVAIGQVRHSGSSVFLYVIRDISDRKRNELELRRARDELERRFEARTAELADLNQRLIEEHTRLLRADRLSSIGLIAASVAHEINNPLCGVMGLTKSLRDRSMPDAKFKEYLDTIQDGLERMRASVQGLLDYARERPLAMERVDVAEVVGACLRLAGLAIRKKQVEVEVSLAEDEFRVHADRARLMQVLTNLLLNSAYATPSGGTINISAQRDGGRVGIVVADSGAGIPREIIDRVCEPFFTTKPSGQGTGLGLAIASNIVKAHRGELILESVPDKGTTVTVWLPGEPAALVEEADVV